MVGTSKILTVSYGTFSCTLEGFDEPFSTMRSIAEYFRDLAADDRYFGAEPPTPDAEMLHRIAEREVQKRVVARVDDNGIVLRQLGDPDSPDDGTQSEIAAKPTAKTKSKSKAKKDKAKAKAKARVLADDSPADGAAPAADADAAGDSIAAKMLRIRAAVARSSASDAFIEDQHSDEIFTTRPIEAAFADIEEKDEVEAVAEPQEEIEEVQAEVGEDVGEIEEAEAFFAGDDELASNQFEAEAEADLDTGSEDDALSNVMSALQLSPSVEEDAEEEPAAELLDDEPAEEAEAPRGPRLVRTRVIKVSKGIVERRAEIEEEVVAEQIEVEATAEIELQDDALAEFDEIDVDDLGAEEMEDDVLGNTTAGLMAAQDEAVEDEVEEQAEAAILDDDAENDDQEDLVAARAAEMSETVEADFAASLGENDLSAEAEANLLKELAEVEREVVEDRHAAVEHKARKSGQDDVSVTRILAETNSQLDDSESSRRRTTIAHLKAAVAATRADREDHADEAEDDEEIDRYRDDLNRVVRPRRPGDSRPIMRERRLAPLMLVSEQRIDLPTLELSGDVSGIRPRRITAGNLALMQDEDPEQDFDDDDEDTNLFAGDTSFSEFAQTYGAVDIADQIEAAAAHAIFVEGRPHVSRPYLMKQVSDLADNEHSREDALRAFGTLLRQGRIQKLKRGQFGVSKNSRFRPDGAAAE